MSQSLTHARPYARAAFAAAQGQDQLAHWSQALMLAAQVAAQPEVGHLLGHPALTSANVQALLAPKESFPEFERFVQLLAYNRRLRVLPEISGMFEQLRMEAERTVKAHVTSAAELSPGELENLVAALRKRFDREVEVTTAVDPSLIGGAVIDTGDLVIDGSIRNKLARLQASLTH